MRFGKGREKERRREFGGITSYRGGFISDLVQGKKKQSHAANSNKKINLLKKRGS